MAYSRDCRDGCHRCIHQQLDQSALSGRRSGRARVSRTSGRKPGPSARAISEKTISAPRSRMKHLTTALWLPLLLTTLSTGLSTADGQDDANANVAAAQSNPAPNPTPDATSGLVVPAMPGTVGGSCLCPCPAELTYPQAAAPQVQEPTSGAQIPGPGNAPGTVASPSPSPMQDNWSSGPSSSTWGPGYTSKW